MEKRILRLESASDALRKDVAELRVDFARFDERSKHFPTKGFIFAVCLALLAATAGLTALIVRFLPAAGVWSRRMLSIGSAAEAYRHVMIHRILFATALALLAATPAAAAMTVGTFLAKAAPLRANPLLALASPDFATLQEEARSATRQLKAEREARRLAGKPPIACVPDGTSVGITDMLGGLDALSAAEKRLPLKDGYARVLARRYPCR